MPLLDALLSKRGIPLDGDSNACGNAYDNIFPNKFAVPWVDFVQALYEYLDDASLPAAFYLDEARHFKGRGAPHSFNVAYGEPADLNYKCLKELLGAYLSPKYIFIAALTHPCLIS